MFHRAHSRPLAGHRRRKSLPDVPQRLRRIDCTAGDGSGRQKAREEALRKRHGVGTWLAESPGWGSAKGRTMKTQRRVWLAVLVTACFALAAVPSLAVSGEPS